MYALTRNLTLISILCLPASLVARADGPDGPPPRPPREAVEACASLDAQDACSFVIDGRTLHGTCMPGPRSDLPLACRPADAPRR